MSILIKGMEMPESCLECPFKWAGDSMTYCLAQTPTMKSLMPVKLHEIRWKKFSNAVEKFRWKEASCPLVPVPPHGRLIDADAFERLECSGCDGACEMVDCDCINCDADCRCDFMLDIRAAPTIIPAEETEK